MEHDGITNTVRDQGDGTVLKQFSRFAWTVHVMDALRAALLDVGLTTRQDRIRNEIAAKDLLRDHGISTQDVVDHTDTHVLLERVPGQDLRDYLQQADPSDCFDTGYRKGQELQTVHEGGHAYIDCRCGNTIVDGETLYSIDHELFEDDAAPRIQVLDLITLLGTAKLLPEESYRQFMHGFRAGYTEPSRMRRIRTVLELPCALGYAALVEKDARAMGRVLRNWLQEHASRRP